MTTRKTSFCGHNARPCNLQRAGKTTYGQWLPHPEVRKECEKNLCWNLKTRFQQVFFGGYPFFVGFQGTPKGHLSGQSQTQDPDATSRPDKNNPISCPLQTCRPAGLVAQARRAEKLFSDVQSGGFDMTVGHSQRPCATYFDVHQRYRVLTHRRMVCGVPAPKWLVDMTPH